MGYRVIASCRSLIWHLSAAVKVPTWVLYYDTRNSLDVLRDHCDHAPWVMDRAVNKELKRAAYYALIGRMELARLIVDGVDDFYCNRMGKRDIVLFPPDNHHQQELELLPLMDPSVSRILIPWTVNMYATGLQEILVRACLRRPELVIDFLTIPGGLRVYQFPGARFISLSRTRLLRYITYLRLRNNYDLVLQSEYERIIGLSWLGARIMFLSNDSYCVSPSPKFLSLTAFVVKDIASRWKTALDSGKN